MVDWAQLVLERVLADTVLDMLVTVAMAFLDRFDVEAMELWFLTESNLKRREILGQICNTAGIKARSSKRDRRVSECQSEVFPSHLSQIGYASHLELERQRHIFKTCQKEFP